MCSSGRIRGKIQYGSIETMEGAKLVGEISTDWGSTTETNFVSDRLEAFTSSVSADAEESADG